MAIGLGSRVGPYEVTALLGEGGMGKVWRVHDAALKRDAALKVLPDAFASDPERLARFRREAQVLASLNHPNIAHVYGLEQADGVQALVMELVEGPTLAERIADVGRVPPSRGEGTRGGPAGTSAGPAGLPIDEALAIARQVTEALEAAHEKGIIHRDLKPANIKVRDDGVVKVLDFGLAKALEGAASAGPGPQDPAYIVSQSPTLSVAATRMGVILGTAAYMAPEQAKGKTVDKRADIWGFGCVLFEMLGGQRPFGGETVSETLADVMKSEPRWESLPAALPSRVMTILRRCLEKDPTRRVRDIGDVRLALDGAFDTPLNVQAMLGAAIPVVPPAPLWRRAAAYGGTLLLGAVAAATAVWISTRPEPPRVARFQVPLAADTAFSFFGRHLVTLSPDGQLLVYQANNGLYMRRMDGLEATPIRGTEEGGGRSPFFSPDGQWIGFWAGGQLKRVGPSGGAPIVICEAENPWGVSWGEDDTILYGQGDAGIWKVAATGGQPERLIQVEEGEQAHGPQLLPGGDWVLFTFRPKGVASWDDAQIVAQSVTTGERRVIVSGGRDARYLPTGHLVYGLKGVLLAAPFDVGTLQVRGAAVSLVEAVGDAGPTTGAVHFSVAASGSLVYVPSLTGGRRQLVFVSRDGREEPLAAEPRAYVNPRISPDGSRVALFTATDLDVWVWNVASETLTRFTFDPNPDTFPSWSPDGSRIVFTSDRQGGGLFWQRADGTGTAEQLLESTLDPVAYGWSPDGSLIFDELGRSGQRDIRLLRMNGVRTATTLLGTAFYEAGPALSPNGRWLAYDSTESGRTEVYVRPFPDVDQGKWQVSRGGGEEPAWSADGGTLYYLGPDSIMAAGIQPAATFAAGAPSPVLSRTGYAFPGFDIAPDGRFLMQKLAPAEGASEVTAHLVLVENWFEELKRLVPTN
ncbi:MAG: protein kinase domain-containing protein [Vicinamibacterales bacterium]